MKPSPSDSYHYFEVRKNGVDVFRMSFMDLNIFLFFLYQGFFFEIFQHI